MLLSQLLRSIYLLPQDLDRNITGLCQDSRQVKPGYIFFAYRGAKQDGKNYVLDAVAQNAAAILTETKIDDIDTSIPILYIPKLTAYISLIAARFYHHPSRKLKVVGVTGSNGKTSFSQFLAACLTQLKKRCAVIGTLGYGLYGHLQPSTLTTPDAVDLQRWLSCFLNDQIEYVAMEVSSHRLAQKRLNGMEFSAAVFTNLTRDHLDYHRSLKRYAAAKRSLFNLPGVMCSIINYDDPFGRRWLPTLKSDRIYAYSMYPQTDQSIIFARNFQCDTQGIYAQVQTPWGETDFHNPFLFGQFNLGNLLAVLTTLLALGFPIHSIQQCLVQLKSSPGRMEYFGGNNLPIIVIDYAHTPDALAQVLKTLRAQCSRKLWCVFGCGGDRDRGKRPLMGEIAQQYADQIILTDDNPRTEDAKKITDDILSGMKRPKKVVVEHDRRAAICFALAHAKHRDLVLISGKGHENYQILADRSVEMSDREIVSDWMHDKLLE